MAPLTMVALGDCLGSLCPPQVAVTYRWPGQLLLNGTLAGAVQIAAPQVPCSKVPPWLVVGVDVALAASGRRRPDWSRTSLGEVAGPNVTRNDVLRALVAHFLAWLNTWQERGFAPVHAHWMMRAEGRVCQVQIAAAGSAFASQVVGLEHNGD